MYANLWLKTNILNYLDRNESIFKYIIDLNVVNDQQTCFLGLTNILKGQVHVSSVFQIAISVITTNPLHLRMRYGKFNIRFGQG